MKRIVTGCVVVMLVAAVVGLPGTCGAGQREWATTGKILTGFVIGGILGSACHAQPAYTRTEVVYERPVYVTRYVERVCPRPVCSETVVVRTQPIVVYLADGRRIYQPAVHGCAAYIQVWSEVTGEWVSVKQYPSIW
jgi:hypothetical protein